MKDLGVDGSAIKIRLPFLPNLWSVEYFWSSWL